MTRAGLTPTFILFACLRRFIRSGLPVVAVYSLQYENHQRRRKDGQRHRFFVYTQQRNYRIIDLRNERVGGLIVPKVPISVLWNTSPVPTV